MVKIKPKPKTPNNYVDFEELENGSCFLMNDALWQKSDDINQDAFQIGSSNYSQGLCGTKVIPVDIEVTWKKKS